MKEDTFYKICDSAEEINENITNNYFPSPEEIDKNVEAYGIEEQVGLLAYFASNPFKRMDNPLASDDDYLRTVKHCKKKLDEVQLCEQ